MMNAPQQTQDASSNMMTSPPILDPDDPLLIAQSLTYITDDGSVALSFSSAPFSFAVPLGAHSTVVGISVGNLFCVAWFWYNHVRSVDITTDGGLRFWIGNVEIDVPFSKILEIRRIAGECSIVSPALQPHRGFLSTPTDGVAILTSVPSTPFFMWPRSAGKPERRLGPFTCPRLKIVFSPAGGGLAFIRDVENEMRNFNSEDGKMRGRPSNKQMQSIPAYDRNETNNRDAGVKADFFDV